MHTDLKNVLSFVREYSGLVLGGITSGHFCSRAGELILHEHLDFMV
jgi:hypothetical protein